MFILSYSYYERRAKDLEVIYITLIVLLLALCIYMIAKQKKQNKRYFEELAESQSQAAATMERTAQMHQMEFETMQQQLIDKHESEMDRKNEIFAEEIYKKDRYIHMLENFSINRGEVQTHKLLVKIKKDLIQQGLINQEEMILLGNLFVPFWVNGNIRTRQMDHVVLLPTGVYIIETKYWSGTILHGVSYQGEDRLSPVLEAMFTAKELIKEKTLVLKRIDNRDKEIDDKTEVKVVSYGDPASQVMKSALQLKELLHKKNEKYNFVTPIVYYGYPAGKENRVINYSSDENVNVCTDENQLYHFFERVIDQDQHRYTSWELSDIEQIIKNENAIADS